MTSIRLVPLILLPLALSAFAGDALRLIETAPGVRFWANTAQRRALKAKSHHEGKCGGFMDITDVMIRRSSLPPTRLRLVGVEPKEQTRVNATIAHADEGELFALVTKLSAFHDRKYDTDEGVKAAEWIKSRYAEIAHGRSDIKVDFFAHKFKQPSVIAEISGNGPQKDEVVVIGGHLDSIAQDRSPGADDNASGTATVMETFRLLVESDFRPNRTILFMGYAGEEEGLLGSGEIAAWFRNKGRKVVGVLQFDMTMYPGSSPRITFIADHTNPDLTKFTERLSDEYVKTKWIEDRCGYACSDHASWTRAGFASAFPFETTFEEYNPDIHTAADTTKKLVPTHGLRYLKLAIAFGIELAQVQGAAFRLH